MNCRCYSQPWAMWNDARLLRTLLGALVVISIDNVLHTKRHSVISLTTNKQMFTSLNDWIKSITTFAPKSLILRVGTPIDDV